MLKQTLSRRMRSALDRVDIKCDISIWQRVNFVSFGYIYVCCYKHGELLKRVFNIWIGAFYGIVENIQRVFIFRIEICSSLSPRPYGTYSFGQFQSN